MIPKAAVKAYLSQPREDHRWIKRLRGVDLDVALAALSPRPKLNPKCHTHQKACVYLGIAFPQFAYWLDMGCVAGETLLETEKGPVRIERLAEVGEPICVWANTPDGVRLVPAEAPFCKGTTRLYEVRFVSGRSITVAANHWFLTARGWISCAGLGVGERLPIFDAFHPRSNAELAPLEYQLDARRSCYRPLDCQDRYCIPSCGEQPLAWLNNDQAFSPSLSATQERGCLELHAGGRDSRRIHIFRWLTDRLSMRGFQSHEVACCGSPVSARREYLPPEPVSLSAPNLCPAYGRSHLLSGPDVSAYEALYWSEASFLMDVLGEDNAPKVDYGAEYTCGSWARSNPIGLPSPEELFVVRQVVAAFSDPSSCPAFDTVIHIAEKGEQRYFDLHVPRFHNYIAQGLCHHNTGKTLITLELLRYWFEAGKLQRAIIFVTSDKAFPTWKKQIAAFDIGLPYITLEGSSEQKWDQLASLDRGLVFVTYPGAVAMVARRKKGKRGKMELDPKKLKLLAQGAQCLVMDESTRAGHKDSLTHKLCAKLRDLTGFACYALAGRPFGRDPTMLWAQHLIVDGGETLGETLGLFREAFFTKEKNEYTRNKYAFDYTFQKAKKNQLMSLVQHRSISYAAEECIDLPKLLPMIEEVKLPQEAGAYYRKVVDNVIAARGNLQEMKNAFMRMRQLSSGFLGFRNEDTGERAEVSFDENPKLDRLLELVEDVPLGRKALIFYEFTYSGRRIVEELKARGIKPVWLWSGTKNSQEELRRFQEDDEYEFAVINSKVGAYSLDGLQVANYLFFYESPVSVIDREQAERRLRRQGQKRTVFQYDLVVKGTLDQQILTYHVEGADLLKSLRANPSSVLRNAQK